tara:strand:- start:69 stop:1130 length:1062 start_codon:yes stop_codon:yes gene_type:complete
LFVLNSPAKPKGKIQLIKNDGNLVAVEFESNGVAEGEPLDDLKQACTVKVMSGDEINYLSVPRARSPIAGTYLRRDRVVRFDPLFLFRPGVHYLAEFRLSEIVSGAGTVTRAFTLPPVRKQPASVLAVYPSANAIPENLLRFYIHFSAPMRRGNIYEHIKLLDRNHKPVDLPFLEIDEELWTIDQKCLTLFIDPGRIKRGVKPLEDIGPAIEFGQRYTLRISREVRDATGAPLRSDFNKTFDVVSPDRLSIRRPGRSPRPATERAICCRSILANPSTMHLRVASSMSPMQRTMKSLARRISRPTNAPGNSRRKNAGRPAITRFRHRISWRTLRGTTSASRLRWICLSGLRSRQ